MADWPVLRLKGGPHGRKIEVSVDDVPVEKVTKITLEASSVDAIRATVQQIVYLDVEVAITRLDRVPDVVVVTVSARWPDISDNPIATSTADTAWEALRDCSEQLRLAAQPSTG